MDYDMVAGVTGTVTVDEDAMSALLDWYLPDDSLVVVSTDHGNGAEQVVNWCKEVGQEYVIIPEEIVNGIMSYSEEAFDLSLIVLGIEENEETIQRAWLEGIEVADLTRAMYIVQQGIDLEEALDEPVTHAHEISDGLGSRGSLGVFVSQDDVQSRAWATNVKTTWTREEIEEIVSGLIKIHEERYHTPDQVVWEGSTGGRMAAETNPVTEIPKGKIRCIKDLRTGDVRVAPRAKPKAGEREVWLTQEEVDAVQES